MLETFCNGNAAVRIVNEDLRVVLHFLVHKSAKLCPNNYKVVVISLFLPEDLVVPPADI